MFVTRPRLSGLWPNRALVLVATLLAGSVPLALAHGQGRTDQLYISGTPAPGGNGTLDFLFEHQPLNESGQVAITAAVAGTSGGTSDNQGIYRLSDSGIVQLARKGQAAPDGNGVFGSLFSRTLNDAGQVAFSATLSGTSGGTTDNAGIFRGDGTNMIQIAREGQVVPGGDGAFQSFGTPVLNLSGQAAFHSTLSATTAGADTGVYRGADGIITQIAREGQAAPDGNGTLESFGPVSLNNAGQTAFRATLTGTSGGTADYSGIFSGNGGSLTQIVRGGQAVAGGNGVFADFNFSNHSTFNNAGQAAFYAILTGTSGGTSDDRGIYRGSGGAVTQVAREGQAAPDANGVFSNFSSPILNDAGQVAFQGFLAGTNNGSNDNSGIYRGNGLVLTPVARKGQAAPDANGVFSNFDQLNIGSAGQVVFLSNLTGTSGGSSDTTGIFVGNGTDLLQVVRRGDTMAGSTVTFLLLTDSGAVNQHGQVAYSAGLADGNNVIVVNRWTPELHWRATFNSTWDTAGRWTLGLNPAEVHDVFIDPAASVTVTGPATDRTVRSLRVGGGTGLATLELRNGARLTAVNGVTIQPTGTLSGDGSISGTVTNHGNIVANNLVFTGTVTNHGSIRGDGRVHAQLVNAGGGEIRANGGENLWLSGATLSNQSGGRIRALGGGQIRISGLSNTNAGLIEIHDGSELISTPRLTNSSGTGLISLRDGSLIGNGGIANAGSIALTLGNSTIQGDVTNTGTIQVSGGAHATFFDDVVQNGTLQVSTVGNTISTAVLIGAFTGSGGFVGGGDVFALGDLRPGNSPASVLYDGNLFLGSTTETYIELGGLGDGLFDQLVVTGDLNLSGDLYVSLIGGHALGYNQQYLIGDIEGNLLGQFNGLGEGALVGNFGGHDLFITYAAGGGNGIGLFTALPEPNAGLLLIAAMSGIAIIRRQRVSALNEPTGRIGQIGRTCCAIAALAAMLAFPGATLMAQPTITNLGVLPNGSLSISNGISADGTTVTGYSNFGQFTDPRAFRWTLSGGMQDLGTLPSYSSSIGNAVNADGSVIVGGGSGFQHAWRWTAGGGMQDLGTFAGGTNSTALGISADGSLVTGWSQANGLAAQRPFSWTSSGGMQDMGVLTGGNAGVSTALSGNGLFVAGYSNYTGSGSATHAVRWTPGGIEDLGSIAGSAEAYAISYDGSVVVGWTATNNGMRAFRWTASAGMVNLGVPTPPGTFPTSEASAVSRDGLTIGGSWSGGNSAFFWREDLGPVDFRTWLTAEGADTSGWVFSRITGLSYDGSIITGTGFYNNQQRGWVVDLNVAVPEPGAGLLVAFATGIFLIRRKRISK